VNIGNARISGDSELSIPSQKVLTQTLKPGSLLGLYGPTKSRALIQSIRAVAIGNAPISADLGSIDIFENSSRVGSKPDVWVCEWFVCCPVGQMKNLIWTGLKVNRPRSTSSGQALRDSPLDTQVKRSDPLLERPLE